MRFCFESRGWTPAEKDFSSVVEAQMLSKQTCPGSVLTFPGRNPVCQYKQSWTRWTNGPTWSMAASKEMNIFKIKPAYSTGEASFLDRCYAGMAFFWSLSSSRHNSKEILFPLCFDEGSLCKVVSEILKCPIVSQFPFHLQQAFLMCYRISQNRPDRMEPE